MYETPFSCPVELTLAVIGGKWKPLILWELRAGTRGFNTLQNALQRTPPGVSHKVLTQQLRQLERDGLVSRAPSHTRGQRVDYALTAFGRTLQPALDALAEWAKVHHDAVGAALVDDSSSG